MKYYLSLSNLTCSILDADIKHKDIIGRALNELKTSPYVLQTFYKLYKLNRYPAEFLSGNHKSTILDSGVFSLVYGKGKIDKSQIMNYLHSYADFISKNQHLLKYFVEFDLYHYLGASNVEAITSNISGIFNNSDKLREAIELLKVSQ